MVRVYAGVYYLARADLRGVEWLSRQLEGFDLARLRGFVRLVERRELQLEDEAKAAAEGAAGAGTEQEQQAGSSGGGLGQDELKEVFVRFDADASGQIDFGEFGHVCAHMGINRSRELLLTVFVRADANINNEIDQSEFFHAIELLKTRIAQDALRELGFTPKSLFTLFALRLVLLFLILFYLVMGLQIFSTKDDLINLVLNAALPILVGLLFLSHAHQIGRAHV